MRLYLDTSVLVPLHVQEPTSEAATQLLARSGDPLLVSDFGQAELNAALMARVRSGALSSDHADNALEAFERDTRGIIGFIEITSADVRTAGQLVRRLSPKLRVPDAIHVAVCLRLGATLISSDQGQVAAARFHGVSVIEPARA